LNIVYIFDSNARAARKLFVYEEFLCLGTKTEKFLKKFTA